MEQQQQQQKMLEDEVSPRKGGAIVILYKNQLSVICSQFQNPPVVVLFLKSLIFLGRSSISYIIKILDRHFCPFLYLSIVSSYSRYCAMLSCTLIQLPSIALTSDSFFSSRFSFSSPLLLLCIYDYG